MVKHDDSVFFWWATCKGGYRLNTEFVGTENLSPVSDDWDVYDPDFEVPDIHRKLAGIAPTNDGLHGFVSQYGTLSNSGHYTASCGLYDAAKLHKKVTAVLAAWDAGEKELAVKQLCMPFPSSSFDVGVQLSPAGNVDYKFVPKSLASFIELQLIKELAGGLEWKTCAAPGCSRRFAVSLGSGAITQRQTKTKRARFCSDACRQAAHREKRKAK